MKKITTVLALAVAVFIAVPALAQIDVEGTLEVTADLARTLQVEAGETITLKSSGSLDDDIVDSFIWTQVGGPSVQVEQGAEGTASVTPTEPGTYEFRLVAVEGLDSETEVIETIEIVVGAATSAGTEATTDLDPNGPEIMESEIEAEADSSARAGLLAHGIPMLIQGESSTEAGVEVRMHARSRAEVDADGSEDGEASGRSVSEMHVAGATVRGWDSEKKQAVLARVNSQGEITTANDFGLFVASKAIENEGVSDIDVSEERAEVSFNARIRLFGVIPMNVRARAQANAEGEVNVKYPWYGFLATKGNVQTDVYTSMASEIHAEHRTHMSMMQNVR